MTMHSSILGLIIASSIAVGWANADESNQNDNHWTGFYAGVHGGLAQSDSKETLTLGAPESAIGGSRNTGNTANSSDLTAGDLQHGALSKGLESELGKALGTGK